MFRKIAEQHIRNPLKFPAGKTFWGCLKGVKGVENPFFDFCYFGTFGDSILV
jgi:hypothetical protein